MPSRLVLGGPTLGLLCCAATVLWWCSHSSAPDTQAVDTHNWEFHNSCSQDTKHLLPTQMGHIQAPLQRRGNQRRPMRPQGLSIA